MWTYQIWFNNIFFLNYYQRLGPISEMYTQPSDVMSYLNIDPWDIFLFI